MPQTAFDLSANQGAAVLGLLERAQVPPNPAFYKLLFDYVSGAKGAVASRVGAILAGDGGDASTQLYEEFVAPYENKEPIERALGTMVARLTVLDRLIVNSMTVTTEHSRSLRAADQQLDAERIDPVLLGEWILRLKVNNERMRRANAELSRQLVEAQHEIVSTQAEIRRSRQGALRDTLTGVANRAGLDAILSRVRKDEPTEPLSIAIVDIDRFKSLNDTYGHQAGDSVLRAVTRALASSAGSVNMVGRMGGDEFVVLLPGAPLEEAADSAETLRLAVTSCDLSDALGGATLGEITASVGVAQLQPDESIAEMFERADRCLYRAKQSGRNRVEALIEG